jgi:cytidine deaminase
MRVLLFIVIKFFLSDSIPTRRECVVVQNRVFYEASKYSEHAEKNAIKKISDKNILKKCKIFIIRIKNGEIIQETPCDMCKKLLKKYGVNKIHNIDKY